jgi:hypothetical protein
VPWADGEIDDWLAAVDPERIGPAPAAPAVGFTITWDIKVSDVVTVQDLLVPFVYEVADLVWPGAGIVDCRCLIGNARIAARAA